MKRRKMRLARFLFVAIVALCARSAPATTIQDLVRIKGHEQNVLTGMGIVVGLNGTGDTSRSSRVAARPYARLLTNLGNPVSALEELDAADAYAIVAVRMVLPPTGVREGDRLDVSVDKLFNAESLEGGRLVVSLLRPPGPDSPDLQAYAYAEGPLVIEGDNPASAVIRTGGQMIRDVRANPVGPGGSMGLVLKQEYAGYPIATTIADAINGFDVVGDAALAPGYEPVAIVEDAKNIRIRIPTGERARPASFIAWLMTLTVDPSFIHTRIPARVVINERAGIISVTGNVQLGPVGITHRNLQITSIAPAPDGAPPAPDAAAPLGPRRWAGLDTTDGTSRNSTRLVELLEAFDQLDVGVEDQIAIIHELKRSGALHAEIVTE